MSDALDRRVAAPFGAWERSLALRYLLTKRRNGGVALVSILSFAAIALAVAALIITMSIMNGFRAELTSKILGFNGHAFVVGGYMTADSRESLVHRLRGVPGVIEATPMVESQALVQGPNSAAGAVVRGVSPEDLRAMPLIAGGVRQGALTDFGAGDAGGDRVIVGEKLAQTLGVGVGDPITIISPSGGATAFGAIPPSKTYVVAAVFSVGMSEYDQTYLYMPLTQAQLLFGREDAVDFIEIKLKDPDAAPGLKTTLAAVAGSGSVVSDWTERNRAYFGALKVEHNVMRMIFMFIVALAALNIISGLVMLVKNKGRDIAILRTMGAGQGAILRIFFMTGALIGTAGALAGLTFGVLFCWNIDGIQRLIEWVTGVSVFSPDVYFLSRVPQKIDWLEVVGVLVWALASAFLFSLIPAWRASRLEPVDALRYE